MLIGIGGELESGKTTAAEIFVRCYQFTEKSFAKNLKEMCKKVFDLTDYHVYDTEGKKQLFTIPIILEKKHIEGIIHWAFAVNGFELTADMTQRIFNAHLGTRYESPRKILQHVGTEILRDCIDQNYHIKVIEREIKQEKLEDVILSDARFQNERDWIKSKGGVTILTYNPQNEPTTGTHQSEQVGEPELYDYTIINDKRLGLKQLQKSVHMVANMIHLIGAESLYHGTC